MIRLGEIPTVLGRSAPQSLAFRTLPFRALASLAARAPLGGEREVVLGCFMAARLASLAADAQSGDTATSEARGQRAAAARTWFAGLALPAALRTLFGRLVDASAGNDRRELGLRLSAVAEAASRFLDEPARAEMSALVERLYGDLPG
jgi:hypothetical protein